MQPIRNQAYNYSTHRRPPCPMCARRRWPAAASAAGQQFQPGGATQGARRCHGRPQRRRTGAARRRRRTDAGKVCACATHGGGTPAGTSRHTLARQVRADICVCCSGSACTARRKAEQYRSARSVKVRDRVALGHEHGPYKGALQLGQTGAVIHLAPGQEKHVPYEAWHVVQQAQGRVKPTMQMKAGVPVNDDAGLEHEADAMGTMRASLPWPMAR